MYEILEGDLESQMRACLAFAQSFWEDVDPYHRHEVFEYNWSLTGADQKRVVTTPMAPSGSITVPSSKGEYVESFERPERLARPALANHQDLVSRGLEYIRFRMQERKC